MSQSGEELMDDVEVVIRYFSCRHCEVRFGSLDDMTEHIHQEHQTGTNSMVKQEILEDGMQVENEDYVIIEERQLLSQLTDNQQILQQLANEDAGQFVLQLFGNDNAVDIVQEVEERGEEEEEEEVIASTKKTPKPSRSMRKRKAVDKDFYPSPTKRMSGSKKKKEMSAHVLSLSGGSNELHSDEINLGSAKHDEEDEDDSFPDEYTPTHKSKKGRIFTKVEDSSLRKFPCPFEGCKYVAKYRSNLWDHKKTHTGEKPYVCTWPSCSMKFSQTHQLKLHLRSHTGERPYVCDWEGCNSAFSQKPGLKSHMLTHTGEKPFKCDYPGCTWTFRLKGALTDHKRAIHENAKKYICSWPGCAKRFLQHCHLKKHIMGHADIKPFSCDWPNCNYKAVTAAYVSNHRKTHTGEKNYECTYPSCNKKFVKSSHVNRHRSRCHPELFATISGIHMYDDDEYDDEEEEGEIIETEEVHNDQVEAELELGEEEEAEAVAVA